MLLKTHRQKGAMLITASLWLITLVGFAALAFDIGHLMIVRNELQNGADAAALAGANCLDKTTAGSGTDCTPNKSSALNWDIASTKATNSIGLNKSDSTALVNGTVQTGYWNVNGGTALQPTTLSPLGACTMAGGVMTTACHKPAVMVTIQRASGSNGGPVGTLISSMFGGAAMPISARAVAVISSPGNVLPGNLVPIAINACMFDKYWDMSTGTPKIFKSTDFDPYGLSTVGQPWEFKIGSAYHYDTCQSGQWTTFDKELNDVPAVRDLINNGNPKPLDIGSNTWIDPGTKATLYDTLDTKYPTPPGADVTVVVVKTQNLDDKGWATVEAFAGFHISDVNKKDKYIQGHFIPSHITSGSGGIGPFYGTYTPPRLAQ